MQNTYMNKMLQRIADAVERWTGGSITIDVTGAGDMQGATSASAGVHGLVPAPAAGDENKVLSGAGTWIDAGGGISYSLTEQYTGLKWIDGKKIYQTTFSFTANLKPTDWVQIGTIPNIAQPISAEACTVYDNTQWFFGNDYVKARVDTDGTVFYYSEKLGSGTAPFYITVRYTKTI